MCDYLDESSGLRSISAKNSSISRLEFDCSCSEEDSVAGDGVGSSERSPVLSVVVSGVSVFSEEDESEAGDGGVGKEVFASAMSGV